jgi:hypothetical protein
VESAIKERAIPAEYQIAHFCIILNYFRYSCTEPDVQKITFYSASESMQQ